MEEENKKFLARDKEREERMRKMEEEIRLLRGNGPANQPKQPQWEVYRVSACGKKKLYKCLDC